MENGNFTGFAPEEVKIEIDDFYTMGKDIYDALDGANSAYYERIYKSWYSPKAKEFEVNFYNMGRAIYNLHVAYNNIAASMQNAYNIHAQANGMGGIPAEYEKLEYQPEGAKFGDMHLEEASPSGAVGMNKEAVIQATIEFGNTIKEQLELVYGSYQMRAFFDPEGNQISALVASVNAMRDRIALELNNTISSLKKCIENETTLIAKAVVSATQSLETN